MIIIRLVGGLGNQMFQYALGRSFEIQKKCLVKYDKTELEKPTFLRVSRPYNLDVFNLKIEFAGLQEIAKLKGKWLYFAARIFSKLSGRKISWINKPLYFEKQAYSFEPAVFDINYDAYLLGYWNNEKYFRDIRNVLLKDFTVSNSPSKTNKRILEKISGTHSISIHIRRGDYVKDKKTFQYHGACSLEYYTKAVKVMAKKVKSPSFFVFSDDITWAKKNLNLNYPVYFVGNDDKHNYEDLRLMQNCKHNIIANSSFSWWGAWLNKNPEKIVIAPKRWLRNANVDASDVIPREWIRI